MWKSFPIQTSSTPKGEECSRMVDNFSYIRDPDVEVSTWKDAPGNVKQWCLSLWKDTFGTLRPPVQDDDMLGWIPAKATITASYGQWIGETRSRRVVYINHLFVDSLCRGEGIASKLIHSIANEACTRWGKSQSFLFEVEHIPPSLLAIGATPLCRYNYVWIPFHSSNTPAWTPSKLSLKSEKGFHGKYPGWLSYSNQSDTIVFDSCGDIVWYTNFSTLSTFDGFLSNGSYCRVFHPLGSFAVFAQNMYFEPSAFTHYLLS